MAAHLNIKIAGEFKREEIVDEIIASTEVDKKIEPHLVELDELGLLITSTDDKRYILEDKKGLYKRSLNQEGAEITLPRLIKEYRNICLDLKRRSETKDLGKSGVNKAEWV